VPDEKVTIWKIPLVELSPSLLLAQDIPKKGSRTKNNIYEAKKLYGFTVHSILAVYLIEVNQAGRGGSMVNNPVNLIQREFQVSKAFINNIKYSPASIQL
jgi:hypothetical protein